MVMGKIEKKPDQYLLSNDATHKETHLANDSITNMESTTSIIMKRTNVNNVTSKNLNIRNFEQSSRAFNHSSVIYLETMHGNSKNISSITLGIHKTKCNTVLEEYVKVCIHPQLCMHTHNKNVFRLFNSSVKV